jgi:hypothetical protein
MATATAIYDLVIYDGDGDDATATATAISRRATFGDGRRYDGDGDLMTATNAIHCATAKA